MDLYSSLGFNDPRDLWYQSGDPFEGGLSFSPPLYQQNQGRGENIPVYVNESQLRVIRDRGRILHANNEFAICAVSNITNYVVGKGLTYRAVGEEPYATKAQQYIDVIAELNDLAEVEAETVVRGEVEGEAFIRLFFLNDGTVELRFIEPELVRSPTGDTFSPERSFGIETDPEDVQTIIGYWVVECPLISMVPIFVPADEIIHIRMNVHRTSKRGLSSLYPIEQNLKRCEDLLASMTVAAKSRAKIAMIRKFDSSTSIATQNFIDTQSSAKITDPQSNQVTNIEQFKYGSILNAPSTMTHEFPSADLGAAEYVVVLQAELRACGARWNYSVPMEGRPH